MIFWQGKGYWVFIIVLLSSWSMNVLALIFSENDRLYQESPYLLALALLIAAGITNFVSRKLGMRPIESYFLKAKGDVPKTDKPEAYHSFFFIPFQFWTVILVILAIVAMLARLK